MQSDHTPLPSEPRKRRAKGTGSVFQRSDGRWEVRTRNTQGRAISFWAHSELCAYSALQHRLVPTKTVACAECAVDPRRLIRFVNLPMAEDPIHIEHERRLQRIEQRAALIRTALDDLDDEIIAMKRRLRRGERRQEVSRRVRELVIWRDQWHCRYCSHLLDRHSYQIDHVFPLPAGPSTADNLVLACRTCNNRKGNRTPEAAGMILLPEPTRE